MPKNFVFLDLTAVFDSVVCAFLRRYHSFKGLPENSVPFVKSQYENMQNQVGFYVFITPEFTVKIFVLHGCPFYLSFQ